MLALAIAALLQLRGATPSADDAASRYAAAVASLRVRWAERLDAAGWDRDAPAAREAADEVAAEGLDLLARRPGLTSAPDAHALESLLAQTGGAPLNALVQARPIDHARWVEAWLRWGDARPDDVRGLIDQAGLERGTLDAVVRWAPGEAAPLLRHAFSVGRWEAGCTAVLWLPTPLRTAWTSQVSEGAFTVGAAPCLAGAAILPLTQRAAAQWLRRITDPARMPSEARRSLPGGGRPEAVVAGVAVLLAGSPDDAIVRRSLGATLRTDRDARSDAAMYHSVALVARAAPWLRGSPAQVQALRSLSQHPAAPAWHLSTLRARWDAAGLVEDSLRVLSSPGSRDTLTRWSLRTVGALTPDAETARRRAVGALRSFQESTQGRHPQASGEEVERWIAALGERSCDDDACRATRFARGSDELAAREVVRLGGAGLSALSGEAARALVRRVVRRGRAPRDHGRVEAGNAWSATAWAVFSALQGCPPALRGLREATWETLDDDLVIAPWRDALTRSCRGTSP
ncbi:MAG: hypothetical protein U0325_20055 [Polyangiales bacterium]